MFAILLPYLIEGFHYIRSILYTQWWRAWDAVKNWVGEEVANWLRNHPAMANFRFKFNLMGRREEVYSVKRDVEMSEGIARPVPE